MNIALVVHDLHERGGHSLYTRTLADDLARRHDIAVFANHCERPAGARWSFCPVRAWRRSALATVYSFPVGLRSLSSRLAEFEIRHMQGYCGGNPNVVTAHICLAAYLNSLRDISRRSQMSLRMMAAAEARFYRNYEGHVIAVSQQISRELRDFYQVRGPISVIPHGVDAKRFGSDTRGGYRLRVRGELDIAEDSLLALYVGDLTKAHLHLKEFAAASPDIQLLVVTASRQYRWVGRNVRFIPATPELGRYYAAADAFVFPTTYDAFGMVLLEAMASGLPVFSSDRAGGAELITSGKDGYVTPLDEWVEATRAGLSNRDLLRALGREAEKTARKHTWSTVVRNVEQVYFKVAAAESARGRNPVQGNEYRYQQ